MHQESTKGFVIAVAILAGIGVNSYFSLLKFKKDTKWVEHTYQVIKQTEEVLSELKDAETGQRGYLLTGKQSYLEPYHRANSTIHQKAIALRQLTRDNSNQQRRINAVEPLIAKKLAELKQTIDLRNNKELEAALAIVQTDRGKYLMDDIRQLATEIKNKEQ